MSAHIVALNTLSAEEKPIILQELRDIFFESSTRKEFKDEVDREIFYNKYVGHYLNHFPEFCWVALDHQLLGYILGAPRTSGPELMKLQPHLMIFKNYFEQYPAHLHINCHHLARGQGVGSQLMRCFEETLRQLGVQGVHILTAPSSSNVDFYAKQGYQKISIETFNQSPILMMGKALNCL